MSNLYMIPYYPVGSILEFDRVMDMKSIYGGTWELYGAGRMTVCVKENTQFNQAGNTGGAEGHTQTANEVAAHSHDIVASQGIAIYGTGGNSNWEYGGNGLLTAVNISTSENVPNNQIMDVMNPYIVVYRYRKVAD